MTEYISRETVLEILSGKNAAWDAYSKVEAIPAADVRPVKRGRWESSRPDAPMFGFYYCSICGRKRTSPQDNYCPNCGAEMNYSETPNSCAAKEDEK